MPSAYTSKNGKDKKGNQRYKPDAGKYLYNIDTLWLNADSINFDEVMGDGLRERLNDGREYYHDHGEHLTIDLKLAGYENPVAFKVMPGEPPLYQYSIRNDDVAIYFSKKRREDNTYPMKIQINQFILWDKGVEKAYFESLCILSAMGFVPGATKLNRVDFAVHSDQWKWNLKDLEKLDYPRNIADDNKPNFFRLDPLTGDFQTVYYGDRTRCQLRIYNKSIEAKKKKKQYFIDLYEKLGMDKDNVWNVEIEVRRPFIKECTDFNGDKLFDDFELVLKENRLADLWSHLMMMYNHASPHWKTLSDGAAQKGFYKVQGFELLREKDIDSNFEREIAQIAGRLKLAVLNEENFSFKNAIDIFEKKYNEQLERKNKTWDEEVDKKKRLIQNAEINKKAKREIAKQKKRDLAELA